MNQFVKDKATRNKIEKDPSETSSPELKDAKEVTGVVSATSSNSEAMIQQLVQAVGTLAQEVQMLKNDRSEKPRKVMAKADAEMGPPKDRA